MLLQLALIEPKIDDQKHKELVKEREYIDKDVEKLNKISEERKNIENKKKHGKKRKKQWKTLCFLVFDAFFLN